MFNLCRPNLFEEDEYGLVRWANFDPERWWYELVKVCRRWRYLILGSASHLGLCLVCSRGTRVAEMLAHSPPLPLVIDHDGGNHDLSAEDEEGIIFALQHRDRVRRIRLAEPVPCLQKLITALDDQFPMLEYLYIVPLNMENAHLVLPPTFRAPQLSYLLLNHFTSPTESPLLTTTANLVRLSFPWIHPSINLNPSHSVQTLLLLPQLQDFEISFSSPVPNRDIDMLRMPKIAHTTTTLPNLRSFTFGGVSAYLEALLSHMNAPLLERLSVTFFDQLSVSVPHLRQFVTTIGNIRPTKVLFFFYDKAAAVLMFPSAITWSCVVDIRVDCDRLDRQVSSMAQISDILSPLSSAVVDLTLDYRSLALSSECHNQVDRTQWRELLRSFRDVQTLRVHHGLVGELSRCLALDGEPASEILPGLKTLVCPLGSRDDKTFATFVHDREVAGLPIELVEDGLPARGVVYRFGTPAGADYVS